MVGSVRPERLVSGPMTASDGPERGARLTFHGPLSPARADRVVSRLAGREPRTVVDYGCGRGELLLRLLAATPDTTGVGLDTHGPDLERGRAAARERGLEGRVRFLEQPGAAYAEPADLVLCIGSSQVFGAIPEALRALRDRVQPGGRLLFADGFWERHPTAEELAGMWPGASAADQTDLVTLVDQAEAAGFVVVGVETANRDEWEAFESTWLAGESEWLAAHPTHPAAADLRAEVALLRRRFLGGYRRVLGLAYLTLAVPPA